MQRVQRIEEKMRVDLVVQGIYLALQGFVFQFLVVSLHFLFTCGEDINPAERVYSNEYREKVVVPCLLWLEEQLEKLLPMETVVFFRFVSLVFLPDILVCASYDG